MDRYLYLLRYVPDWFVTDQQIEISHDNDKYCNDDKPIEWYDGYKARKARKASIKKSSYPLPGIHQDIGIAVCQKMKKEKLWAFLCLMTEHKTF